MEEEGVWRTINGTHVFIEEGQSPIDALIRQKAKKKEKESMPQEEVENRVLEAVNNGQVFEFSPGPTMTICSRYEKGSYTWNSAKGDCPMWLFEKEMVPELKDEFVVIDDNIGKVKRTSRFKKYGYEVVGSTKEKKKNISEGKYTKEDYDSEYANTWYLMKKKGEKK